jgi:hypothetical protein
MLCEVCLDLIEAVNETIHIQLHHDDNVTAMIARGVKLLLAEHNYS